MQQGQRRGVIIPGFDCALNRAVGYNRDEWDKLLKGLTLQRRNGYLIAVDANGLSHFEVYDERK